jgi:hypothetical protein
LSTTETKRRLLISKWHGRNACGIVASQIEKLQKALGDVNETIETDIGNAREEIKSLEEERDEYAAQLEQTLTDVKYWLHDGIVHCKIVSDPATMLRKIEWVLG